MKQDELGKSDYYFKKLLILGAFELSTKKVKDQRGFFINLFREGEEWVQKVWGNRKLCQINLSNTAKKGTIRGLHYQTEPYSECKLIRCLKGKVWDVAVDLRADSPTFLKWHAVELSPVKNNAIVIPEGCAHGFQSLEDDSELMYIHSNEWKPSHEKGIRWDDKKLRINWPLELNFISERDKSFPNINL